ncbi:unnamed protein product [Meloidogyne enterolobii]|uniref:Uncharacterized protein n=1 Tax=Meloidogyne enterolobii TaxID=390850 RepID=A0ACB1A0N9_MELEN
MGIRAFKSLSIPPESQCLVPIRTETTDDTQIFSVNILDKRLVDQDFCLIPTVIQPKNNLSIIPLINPTQEPKIIYQNMKIAFATELALFQTFYNSPPSNNYSHQHKVETIITQGSY